MNENSCITCKFASHILYARDDRKELMSFYCSRFESMFTGDEPCSDYQKQSS